VGPILGVTVYLFIAFMAEPEGEASEAEVERKQSQKDVYPTLH